MFKDLIESILIFLDGREKIVAQIVIYVFLLSGGGYFLFVYEGDKETDLGNTLVSTDSGAIQNQTDTIINTSTSDTNSNVTIVNEAGEIAPSKTDTPSFNTNGANQSTTGVKPYSNQTQTSVSSGTNPSQSSSIPQNTPSTINPSPKIETALPEKEKEQAIVEPIVLPKKEEVPPQEPILPQDQITQNTTASQTTTTNNQTQQTAQNTPPSNNITTTTTNPPQNIGNTNSGTSSTPPSNTETLTGGGNTTHTGTTGGTDSNNETTGGTSGGTPPQDTGNTDSGTTTPDPENTGTPTGGETTPPPGDSGTSLVDEGEPSIEDYFDNEVIITGSDGPKQVKIVVQTSLSPTYPVPNACSVGFVEMGVYSNISALTTLFVPYSDQYGTTMSIINEYEVLSSGMKKYYKVFIVNSIKNGAVLYKTVNPNNDYHRAFTICLQE